MRLVRGAPGAGKTALVLREFKDALRQGRGTARIVVPTSTLVRHLQHELARDGVVFPPSAVISLRRFVQEMAPELKVVPDGALRVFVRDALATVRPREFAELCGAEGMIATVLETIGLCENAGVPAAQLAGTRRLSPSAKAFAAVWNAASEAVTAGGFVTWPEAVRAAARNASGLRIWMDGFAAFSPLETELIAALAKSCDTTVTTTDTRGGDEIRRMAMRLGARQTELSGRARRPQTELVKATSVEREADEIARRIIELRARGTAFREMGVAVRDVGSYAPLLRGVFERFGIPARFYFGGPLREHPAAIFVGGLIECAIGGWEFGAAIEALRGHARWGASASLDRLDFALREAMPGHGADEILALCGEDETLKERVADCLAIAPWVNESQLPEEWARRIAEFAERIYRPGFVEAAGDTQSLATQRSYAAAITAVVNAVEEAAALPGNDTPVSLEKFWNAARETIAATWLRVRDDRRDVVHVMSSLEARQWDVAALFVCGFTDHDYPKRHARNALLSDRDLDALSKAGFALRRASDADAEEEFLVEALRTRARDALTLSCPSHDASGKSVHSSRYAKQTENEWVTAAPCMAAPLAAPHDAGAAGRVYAPSLHEAMAAQHRTISLTALEELTQCRFKFFAGRTLKLAGAPETPQQRLGPRTNGTILHQALEAWLEANRKGDFVALFEEAFEKVRRELRLPDGFRLEADRIQTREIAKKVSASEKWTAESSQAEVELTLDFPGGITVTGRVDRIDRLNDRQCVIVDYKSSKPLNVRKKLESPTALQGPLYALAARERLNLETVAMMYVAVRDDQRFGWGAVPGADLGLHEIPARWMEDARDRTVERIRDFFGGAVHARPAISEECVWCDFQDACRYEGAEKEKLVTIGGAAGA
ncbi:MAG TPA: PD-(D/E)XK nuclease family protein [Bryobacteraceae bacterium]|nr:PD-(D/E)XK nuclease family protein [Bryobacteraceae bacterium]